MEEAFGYWNSSRNHLPRWEKFRNGADVAFFDERTLRELLGNNFRDVLECREHFSDGEDKAPWLRGEMQRYAVIGRRAAEAHIFYTSRRALHP